MEPARHHIQRVVDRLVYGSRDDPLSVVTAIVDRVGTRSGDELLPALARSLQRELRFDAVAIDVAGPQGQWERAATVGPQVEHSHEVTLRQDGEVVGRLVVGWDVAPSVRTRDAAVLEQLASPLGLAVSWVRLAADLRRSSIEIVSAREEERRRLRRDLHDGVGPTLTGVSLGLRSAVPRLERSGADGPSVELLGRLADEIDAAVDEVKRVVRALRPTALDQLGLIGAVAEFARKLDDELEMHVSLPAPPVVLPAAVEVAAYRIVTEALTNVVRHAGAERCWLTIGAGSSIEIDVIDDGVGVGRQPVAGVGLTAMVERAAELGGAVRFVNDVACGTHLNVRLPAVLP